MNERRPKDQPHRERIDREFERNLLVEAGAGSGKTHSLARRMAAGIASGAYRIEHMAAVTFTRKAAAELRGRFQLALEEELRRGAHGGGAGQRGRGAGLQSCDHRRDANIRAALAGIERFFAGTIHSFCAHLLRERPVESGIAPGFRELDEPEDTRMREESWRDYITRAKASGNKQLLELLDAGVRAVDLDSAFRFVCLYEEVDFPAPRTPRPDIGAAWKAAKTFWGELQKLMAPQPNPDAKCKVLEKAADARRQYRVADPSRPQAVVQFVELWQPKSVRVTVKWWPAGNGPKAAKLLDEFRASMQPFLSAWREYVYGLAVAVLLDARVHVAAERRRHNTLNYADLLQMAARVLREDAQVRRALQRKYRWLFVDEFQDTDPVQAEIILLLAADEDHRVASGPGPTVHWTDVSLRPGALFVVGDPKQSIYRFRRADIDIYSRVKELILASGGDVVPLTANFRSVEPLCGWANDVFKELFPQAATQHAPAFERLDAFRQEKGGGRNRSDQAQRFGVHRLTVPADVADKKVAEHEAAAIARFIRCEFDSGRRRFGDFLVLTRKKKPLAIYARVLEQFGIPVEVSGAGAFGESEEVHHLAVLLRALADPQDSVSLVGVLRGPFFGISDPELFDYVHAGGRLWLFDGIRVGNNAVAQDLSPANGAADGSVAAQGSSPAHGARAKRNSRVGGGDGASRTPHDAGADRVANALLSLREMYRWTRLLPPAAAVERILERTGYLALAASIRGGAEAGDLLHAVDRIRQVSEDGGTLMNAVESLEEDAEAGSDIDSLPLEPGRSDVVRVMNLHKAKGLEADVVFLADPLGGFNPWPDVRIVRDGAAARGYFSLIFKFQNGGSRILAQPADWDQHKAAEQQYLDAEGDRLLYVAATRPRDLLVVGRYAGRSRSTPAWKPFDRWLTNAAELEVPDTVEAPLERAVDLSDEAYAAAALVRQSARASALQPTWSITSVTAEARHVSRVVRRAEGLADDPTTTVTQDTPAHRADAGMAWGTLIHGLLEHAMRHRDVTRNDLRRLAMWLTVEQPELRSVLDEAVDTVQRVATMEFWREAQAAEHSVETPFVFSQAANQLLTGVIDLLFRSGAGWQVIDYKTDFALDGVAERYEQQLAAYSRALAACGVASRAALVQRIRLAPSE